MHIELKKYIFKHVSRIKLTYFTKTLFLRSDSSKKSYYEDDFLKVNVILRAIQDD